MIIFPNLIRRGTPAKGFGSGQESSEYPRVERDKWIIFDSKLLLFVRARALAFCDSSILRVIVPCNRIGGDTGQGAFSRNERVVSKFKFSAETSLCCPLKCPSNIPFPLRITFVPLFCIVLSQRVCFSELFPYFLSFSFCLCPPAIFYFFCDTTVNN